MNHRPPDFVPCQFPLAPFQYMISHTDAELVEAVRGGRREEFSGFERQTLLVYRRAHQG